jgi:hypothetical protein
MGTMPLAMKSDFGEILNIQARRAGRLSNEGNFPQSFFGWDCNLFVPFA